LARVNVKEAQFALGDIAKLPFRGEVFDAICSFYAIIHVPRAEHVKLLTDFHRVLKPCGLVLLCLGAGDLPDNTGNFLGASMFWSHFDCETNLRILKRIGIDILWSGVVKDPVDVDASHLFVLGQKARTDKRMTTKR
ncbi:MAG TPA: class I SAM-dependent methyltransferase, partial [Candidatus Binatus sp.]|nr:class I SAM-dependent methyltransferase [Candidatus Binatus sp.]